MPVTDGDLAIDRELSDLCRHLPLLRLVTPTNVPEAREAFLGGAREPTFTYRPLPDLTAIAARLADVDVDSAHDPVVRHLARAKKRELEVRLDMLRCRGTDEFFLASVEMFGHVEGATLALAEELIDQQAPTDGYEAVSADEFAEAASAELDKYRQTHPELDAAILVDDLTAGVMVQNGDLYIGVDTRVALDRVEPLLAHEVGVHMLTYANGSSQPLQMLSVGLAGYDETQEALGVLAEYLCGGLGPFRLHLLARRVIAAHLRSEGAGFAETAQALVDLGASPRSAFTTTMRAYRAGGMTKDAIYLRGLVRLCAHLSRGGSLELLFVGKISLEDEPLVAELIDRAVLHPPTLVPDFLATETAASRLAEIRAGREVRDLGGVAA